MVMQVYEFCLLPVQQSKIQYCRFAIRKRIIRSSVGQSIPGI